MADYIDRAKLLLHWTQYVQDNKIGRNEMLHIGNPPEWLLTSREVEDAIINTPAADVAPVRHGEWIVDGSDSGDGTYAPYIEVHCSECGTDFGLESGQYDWCYGEPFPWNFCPHCGADMRPIGASQK